MPVIVILLVVVVVGYLAYRSFRRAGSVGASGVSAASSPQPFAFLSNGFLFYREHGGEVQQLHSAYAQEAIDRRENARERQSWKKGTSFDIAAGGRMRSDATADKPLQATAATYAANGDLLYFLKDDSIGGLFRREAATGRELRLLIRQHLHVMDLCLSPDGEQLIGSSVQSGGVANILLLKADGSTTREMTGGDTVDAAPAWIPGVPHRLLFQSAGLARNEQGYVVAMGNATIQMLNTESGSVSSVLESGRFDYLKPRVCPAGNLHFIRRPYEQPRYSVDNMMLDTLFFPFRLLRAVFHYLNFFSMMYSRKPLTSATGPTVQADMKNILLQGRRIDAEKALRSANLVQGVPSLVPRDWELVCRNTQGDERVLATHVSSYDMGADGTIVYSNGCGVFVLGKDGVSRLAAQNELIGEVMAAAMQATTQRSDQALQRAEA